jgi:hypothetical protein
MQYKISDETHTQTSSLTKEENRQEGRERERWSFFVFVCTVKIAYQKVAVKTTQ